jgi:hypothetical protein
LNVHFAYEIKQLNKKYSERHGVKNRWSDKIFEKQKDDKIKLQTKHVETFNEIVSEALEILFDQKSIYKYIKYINVFFVEKKSQFGKSTGF